MRTAARAIAIRYFTQGQHLAVDAVSYVGGSPEGTSIGSSVRVPFRGPGASIATKRGLL